MNKEKLVLVDKRLKSKKYKSQDICFVVKKIVNSTSFKINEHITLGTANDLIDSGRWTVDIVGK